MRSVAYFLIAALSISCAASLDGGGEGEPDAPLVFDASGFPDAGPRVDAMIRFDAPFQHGFNEACADRNQCSTGICILGASGGYCSMLCTAGGCPAGFGCFGVLGLIEPGSVSYVCVRDTNLLCSPCQSSIECSPVASDLCLDSPSGGKFCARDCTMQSCPSGYACADIPLGDAGMKKQCLPTSGACDCQATTPDAGVAGDAGVVGDAGVGGDAGAVVSGKPCSIMTPFGQCAGVRVCNGAMGWGDCVPPSMTDVPDGNYTDENCDGIDGTYSDGIFVAIPANGGEDGTNCGLSHLDPCATISNGGRRAKLLGRHYVYVQAGNYEETVILRDGVHIYGGYDLQWKRAARTTVGHEVTIVGQLYATDDQTVAIVAHDLTMPTTVSDLRIVGGNASGSANGSGRGSYAIHAASANLTVDRVTINAGRGSNGQKGGNGQAAPMLEAEVTMNGKKGGDGNEFVTTCNDGDRGAAGPAGANACDPYASGSPTPGNGGTGGTMDTSCSGPFCGGDACNATAGKIGDAATVNSAGAYGYGGSPGNPCASPGPGGNGRVVNGDGGKGGSKGRMVGRYYYSFPGDIGKVGNHGGGGGGGGGSGGCDEGTDSYGAGGGGGGAGGCAARGGGAGGEGGGSSFGVFAVDSSRIKLRFVTIEQANGGRGGDGGVGGTGQVGGTGGPGGSHNGDEKDGGKGGDGGHGGHGGGGGGGAGGASYGVFLETGSTVDIDASSFINDNGASGGDGGVGGTSAPGFPANDGKTGLPGIIGPTAKQYTCASPASC